MSSDLRRAVEILDKSRYTCVPCRGEQILTTEKRGVLPLVEWLEAGAELSAQPLAADLARTAPERHHPGREDGITVLVADLFRAD